ncbi:MAG: hypothetical protein ACKO2D_10685, partial [Chloroflexota bacterium]
QGLESGMVLVGGVAREVTPSVSDRARSRGLVTLDDVKAAVLRQQPVWWQGKSFHCAACGLDFVSPAAAASHTVSQRHPVLRMD